MKTFKHEVQLNNFMDLEKMKEICKCILKTNIAVKTFQKRFIQNIELENIEQKNIFDAKQGINRIDEIENVNSINMIIMKVCGQKDWFSFVKVITCFSTILNDDDFYKADKRVTEDRKGDA